VSEVFQRLRTQHVEPSYPTFSSALHLPCFTTALGNIQETMNNRWGDDDDPSGKRGLPFQPTPATGPLVVTCILAVTCMIASCSRSKLHSSRLVDPHIFDAPQHSVAARLSELASSLGQIRKSLDDMGNTSFAGFEAESVVVDKTSGARTFVEFRDKLTSDLSVMRTLTSQTKTELLKLMEAAKNPLARVQQPVAGSPVDPFENEYPAEPVDPMPGGPWKRPPDEWAFDGLTADQENVKRRDAVVQAFQDSYDAYSKYAWGFDELQPRSKSGKNWNDDPVNNMALTVVDALATAHLMGLHGLVDKALEYLVTNLSFDADTSISAFETTIRIIGSLLSIYELRGEKEPAVLHKAAEIANHLLWAYNTTTGLPQQTVNLATHHHNNPDWSGGASVLSEFGTVQLEMRSLSYHTKNPIFDMKATHIMSIIEARAPKDMLCPVFMSVLSSNWMTDHVTIGALGDSFYEYLLKQWLLTNKTETKYKELYKRAARGIVDKLVFKSKPSDLTYVAEWKRSDFYHKMDELACFVGGMLALGSQAFDGEERAKMMRTADEITTTCYEMFHRQKSGIAPEYVEFPSGMDFVNGQGYYLLRPETMESIFYMWRLTKDPKWRERGWDIFSAIRTFCKTKESGGYAGIREVNVKEPIRDNLQQSFWLAETLKYTFLLFSDDSTLDLNEWVFNTEAHPLKVRTRDPIDVWRAFEEAHGHVPWLPPKLPGVIPVETDKMKQARLANEDVAWRQRTQKDAVGEEVDGLPDDEAAPFDPNAGMEGIRRAGVTPAPPPPDPGKEQREHEERVRKLREAEIQAQQRGRQKQRDDLAPIPTVAPEPPRKQISANERAAALARQKKLREMEKKRAGGREPDD
jgi:mannosyl-oligosaccharide alpha-1,2-mannosidase